MKIDSAMLYVMVIGLVVALLGNQMNNFALTFGAFLVSIVAMVVLDFFREEESQK